MTYLHDMGILHRDLTTRNLLLDAQMSCKICDFVHPKNFFFFQIKIFFFIQA
jgi:serine/threonine protein kinase